MKWPCHLLITHVYNCLVNQSSVVLSSIASLQVSLSDHVDSYRHIADHLKDVVNKPVEQMTEEEMEFHYFKLHDYDNNNKLDGTEITKALTHFERGKTFLLNRFENVCL